MAHDNQVKNEIEQSTPRKQSRTLSDTVADWLILYAQTYREEITEELAVLYQEALKDIQPEMLHRAFLRAAKSSKFRPTPAEIREAAAIEQEIQRGGNRPTYLDEPPIPEEERSAALSDPHYQELKRKITVLGKQKSL